MRKRFVFGLALCALLLSAGWPVLRAQMTDDQKRNLFLKAREDIRPSQRPEASATPRPKPKTATTPKPTPKPTPEEEDKPAPTPKPTPKTEPEEEREKPPAATPAPKAGPTATPAVTPTPGKTEAPNPTSAPILIEKSGLEADQGFEPAPKNSGGWFRRWRYLTPGVRRAIDQARVQKGRWKYIIVHNSGTRQGNARIFDTYHRRVRKMPNGLAYHFVIGNGSSSGDGEIEIGSRWTKQINGGHVASDYLNNIAIGICLVGDLNRDDATKAQMAALDELIQYLRGRVGKVKGKPAIVAPHKAVNPPNRSTDCPGDNFDYRWLSQKFGQ